MNGQLVIEHFWNAKKIKRFGTHLQWSKSIKKQWIANLVDFELFIGDWSHGIHQAVNKNPKKRQKIMPCDDYNLQNNVFINFVWVIKCLITHRWKNSITSKLDKCQCHNTHRQVEPPVLSKELRFLKTSNTSVSHWFFYKIWHAYTLFEHSRNIINRINP